MNILYQAQQAITKITPRVYRYKRKLTLIEKHVWVVRNFIYATTYDTQHLEHYVH